MKKIDLLNKIANGEEVPLIKYIDKILHWNKEKDRFEDKDGMNTLYEMDFSELNDEIEIIEEEKKIPEKINNGYTKQSIEDMKEARFNSNDMAKICNRIGWLMENRNELSNKIDEIIDYLKSKGDE